MIFVVFKILAEVISKVIEKNASTKRMEKDFVNFFVHATNKNT